MDTKDYKIDGREGNWMVADDIIIDGKQFYLMEHQKYRGLVASVIIDSYGKMVVEECANGFDEVAKKKIFEFVHPDEKNQQSVKQQKARLEICQKYYQNGTYERSRESGTEANYDMVDGCVNNEKKVAVQPIQTMDAKKPKKRTSVIKKLHEKQIAIAKKSGKPVPKYLEQQMEAERSRK